MRKLFILLLAAFALPTAVNAEVSNYYLLGIAERKTFVVPMKSLQLCGEAGIKAVNPKECTKVGLEQLFFLMSA